MSLVTLVYTKMFCSFVGEDNLGNKYYKSKGRRWFGKEKRFVLYHDSSLIANLDSEWYLWLHYLTDRVPIKGAKKNWMINKGTTDYDRRMNPTAKTAGTKRFYTVWRGQKNGKREN